MDGFSAARRSVIRFGVFEIDLREGELRKKGLKLKLQKQPFRILEILLERPGESVTREELQQRIWPADTFVDFDHGLNNSIKKLREALNDSAETPRYIETIPKRGYRFIGAVRTDETLAATVKVLNRAPVTLTPIAGAPPYRKVVHKYTLTFLVVGMLALIIIMRGRFALRTDGQVHAPVIHSLAVLPLENLSDDPTQKYFSYGMTEELTTELAQLSGLKVISHSSTALYENTHKPVAQIARELGVDGVVEGAVQRSGSKVRISVQLIYAPEDRHLWAETYDRDFRDVLGLQSSVAAATASRIRALTGSGMPISPKAAPASPNLQALEAYLQGSYHQERMGSGEGIDGYRSAITYFKETISDDPTFAPAYVRLAHTYDAQFDWRPTEIMPIEKAILAKALELNPQLADAHLLNARIKQLYDCDSDGAEAEFKEAIRLNPNLASAHDAFAFYLYTVGRRDQSMAEAHLAQVLDPEGHHESRVLIWDGQYDRAIEQLRKHLDLEPNDGFTYIDDGLVDAYALKGMHRQAIDALQRGWTLFGFAAIGQRIGKVYATSGYKAAFRCSARQLERLYLSGTIYKPDYIASWYAYTGDKEQTLKWLKIASSDNNHCMAGRDRDPHLVTLRSDPQFQNMWSRTGAPQ